MTTLLDIFDAAVKIGLGITITGVTSIVLSKRMENPGTVYTFMIL